MSIVKSRRLRSAGYVAHMDIKREIDIGFGKQAKYSQAQTKMGR